MRSYLSNIASRFRRDQRGATAVEYGIMVALIAVAIIVAVTFLGTNLTKTFHDVGCKVASSTTGDCAAPAAP